jgi:hypothetical protein
MNKTKAKARGDKAKVKNFTVKPRAKAKDSLPEMPRTFVMLVTWKAEWEILKV